MPPEPLILAFDTSAAHCAAAVLSGDRLLAFADEEMLKGQAERLFPLLGELLAEAGADWRDLTALAVGTGPGNFTGVRIAVAAARGLALSLGIPAHGINGFEALAFGLQHPVLTSIDARQGRVYLQAFGSGDNTPILTDLATLPDGLYVPGLTVTGYLSQNIADQLAARCAAPTLPLAEAMARIAAGRGAPSARPAPLYLRPADAAPSREAPPVLLP